MYDKDAKVSIGAAGICSLVVTAFNFILAVLYGYAALSYLLEKPISGEPSGFIGDASAYIFELLSLFSIGMIGLFVLNLIVLYFIKKNVCTLLVFGLFLPVAYLGMLIGQSLR